VRTWYKERYDTDGVVVNVSNRAAIECRPFAESSLGYIFRPGLSELMQRPPSGIRVQGLCRNQNAETTG
jgi:hypothetical protein